MNWIHHWPNHEASRLLLSALPASYVHRAANAREDFQQKLRNRTQSKVDQLSGAAAASYEALCRNNEEKGKMIETLQASVETLQAKADTSEASVEKLQATVDTILSLLLHRLADDSIPQRKEVPPAKTKNTSHFVGPATPSIPSTPLSVPNQVPKVTPPDPPTTRKPIVHSPLDPPLPPTQYHSRHTNLDASSSSKVARYVSCFGGQA
jgi:hypothetical protein